MLTSAGRAESEASGVLALQWSSQQRFHLVVKNGCLRRLLVITGVESGRKKGNIVHAGTLMSEYMWKASWDTCNAMREMHALFYR